MTAIFYVEVGSTGSARSFECSAAGNGNIAALANLFERLPWVERFTVCTAVGRVGQSAFGWGDFAKWVEALR